MSQSHCSLAQQMNNGTTTAWEVHEFFFSSSSCLSFAFRVEKQCETRKTNDSVGCWLMRLEHTMWLLSLSINRSYELPETVWIYYFMLFAQDFYYNFFHVYRSFSHSFSSDSGMWWCFCVLSMARWLPNGESFALAIAGVFGGFAISRIESFARWCYDSLWLFNFTSVWQLF